MAFKKNGKATSLGIVTLPVKAEKKPVKKDVPAIVKSVK
jgi:hypothetical protein